MDKLKARLVLQSFRADRAPDDFADALEELKGDSDLAAWFAEDQAQDQIIRRKLSEVPVPPALREQILAGPAPRKFRLSFRPLALAAAFVLLAGLALLLLKPAGEELTLADVELRLVETLYRPLTFDFASTDLAALQSWVEANAQVGTVHVPEALASLPGVGCKTLSIAGKSAAVICFRISDNDAVHLFVLPADTVANGPLNEPHFAAVGSFHTASWVEGNQLYVLAGRLDTESLRAFVPRPHLALAMPLWSAATWRRFS